MKKPFNGLPAHFICSCILLCSMLFSLACIKQDTGFPGPVPDDAPYKNPAIPATERAADLLSQMTLNEKLGQMAQVDRRFLQEDEHITEYFLGSLLSGGGSAPYPNTPESWVKMYDRFQEMALNTRLKIPVIYGIDAVHGHNTLYGATIFPHNIGLGATRDMEFIERIGRITALEVAATGLDWTFAPCIAVPQDERWGRTYEGFSEYSPLVAECGAAYIKGLQGEPTWNDRKRILACAKHFAGDGGTHEGKDRGDVLVSEEVFRQIHIEPYRAAIEAGVGSIMVSFNSYRGTLMHGYKKYLTDVLKGEMGFTGFIVSDWEGTEHLAARYRDCVREAVNAGIDMVMIPGHYERFLITLKALVETGEVPVSRIDDAVKRILIIKFRMGLFEHPFSDRTLLPEIAKNEHKETAREAVRKSLVLLKNRGNILPLDKKIRRVFVTGKNADDVGHQCGGWTLTWQGTTKEDIPGTSILQGIKNTVSASTKVTYDPDGYGVKGHDVAIAVVGEFPYAEWHGDKENLALSVVDVDVIRRCKDQEVPVIVVLVSGRPMIVTDHLAYWDAFIAAWLPGSEGQGIADVLFGDYNPSGKLSYSWPKSMDRFPVNYGDTNYDPLFPYGYGLSYK
ncbi:MAG: glycoside hydrolase family 3 C-terminal domain-containing protein [Spirochaetales bacterium]|nr:glycoside hydrolase family 3 C-terminal domain-containing protein [Spirochaetales bacterium]